jgi:Leucine-rich repeat (LRR) protein
MLICIVIIIVLHLLKVRFIFIEMKYSMRKNNMKKWILTLIVIMMLGMIFISCSDDSSTEPGIAEPIIFPDANLEQRVREVIVKPSGEIFPGDVFSIIELDASGLGITDITGIEHFVSLEVLDLGKRYDNGYCYNYISDISVLSRLRKLTELHLSSNQIEDISPLYLLKSLRELNLIYNQITDLSSLRNLVNLESLRLYGNQIVDISSLGNLVSLRYLYLIDNQIIDISSLGNLVNLRYLYLNNNQIVDISSLSNLVNLESLHLYNNQIVDISSLSNLVNLESLYLYNNQIVDMPSLSNLVNLRYLYLNNNQIVDISSLSNLVNLEYLNLDYNQIVNISSLNNLVNLEYLRLASNGIVDIYSLLQNLGLDDGDFISLYRNPLDTTSINTYIPELESRGVSVYFGKDGSKKNIEKILFEYDDVYMKENFENEFDFKYLVEHENNKFRNINKKETR